MRIMSHYTADTDTIGASLIYIYIYTRYIYIYIYISDKSYNNKCKPPLATPRGKL